MIDAHCHFDKDFPEWYNDTDIEHMDSGDIFEADKFYSLGGTLVADEGYAFFENPEIILDGGKMSVLEYDSYRSGTRKDMFYVWGESRKPVSPEEPDEPDESDESDASDESGDVETLLGDANDDGSVDMKDVLLLRKFLAGLATEINQLNADVNIDESLDMKDVLMIRKFLANMIEKLG